MNKKTIDLDDIFKDVESLIDNGSSKSEMAPITIWVPLEYRQKYNHIQSITKKRFVGKIRELILRSLDKVNF